MGIHAMVICRGGHRISARGEQDFFKNKTFSRIMNRSKEKGSKLKKKGTKLKKKRYKTHEAQS